MAETWLINEYPTTDIDNDCYFVSNEQIVTHINSSYDSQIGGATLIYTINGIATEVCDTRRVWTNIAYRTVYFPEPPTGDLLTWLQANAVIIAIELDTTMWQLNSTPDLSTDLSLSIEHSDVSWNTCEYYDDGDVKIASWPFDELQVSTNGFAYWASGVPNFLYCYNSTVFNAVISQFEAQGFTIDQSDLTSQSGYFYAERIDSATAKLHNVRRVVTRFNLDDWDDITSFTNWLSNSAEQLDEYVIPNDVVEVGLNSFFNCNSFSTIIIPDSVTSIGSSAFSGCSSLESITLPFVGNKAHESTDKYQYPFGYIFGTSSYKGGTKTTQYYYGSSTSSTTSSTYYIPSTLKSVTITGSSHIPYGAFYDCRSLTSITILDSVTSIGRSAFSGCSSLTSITIQATTPPTIGYNAFFDTNDCPIYVPASSVNAYKTAWSDYSNRIQAIPPKTYLKTSDTYVNKINGQKIKKIIAGSTIYNIAGVKYINKLKAPKNLTADGTTIEFDEVENAEKYEVFAGGVSIGEFEPQQGETWLINESSTETSIDVINISFTSNNQVFDSIERHYHFELDDTPLVYGGPDGDVYVCTYGSWIDQAYRTVTFETAPTGDLLTWLQANAVKQ